MVSYVADRASFSLLSIFANIYYITNKYIIYNILISSGAARNSLWGDFIKNYYLHLTS